MSRVPFRPRRDVVLVVRAIDLMTDPMIWERMKRVLRERRLGAEDPHIGEGQHPHEHAAADEEPCQHLPALRRLLAGLK